MDSSCVVEIVSGSVVAVLAVYLLTRFLTTPKNLPPGPFAWPLVGSLHLIGTYPHRSLAKLAEQYGPLMSVWFGQKLIVVATSPETAVEFLKTQDANFCSRSKTQAPQILLPHVNGLPGLYQLQGHNPHTADRFQVDELDVTFSDVTPHSKHLRKIFQMQFTTSKKVEAAQQLRADEFAHMLRTIQAQEGQAVNVKFHLEVLAGNVFSQLVMSKRLLQPQSHDDDVDDEASTEKLKDLLTLTADLDRIIGTFNPGDFIPAFKNLDLQGLGGRFREFRGRMDAFMSIIVKERMEERKNQQRENRESKDYLDALLDEVDVKNNIDLDVVKTMLWEIYAAGMETNIASSEWAMTELILSPASIKRAQSELDSVIGPDRMFHESDLPHLPYIKAIAKETLRMHPPVPFLAHSCIRTCKAFGYDIPADTSVFVNVWGLGHVASVFPDPHTFFPERFLPGGWNAGMDYQGQHFGLLPFGSGRRICAGLPVASLMVQSAVAHLVHAFTWTPTAKEGVETMEGAGAASLAKAVPLKACATPRLAPHLYEFRR